MHTVRREFYQKKRPNCAECEKSANHRRLHQQAGPGKQLSASVPVSPGHNATRTSLVDGSLDLVQSPRMETLRASLFFLLLANCPRSIPTPWAPPGSRHQITRAEHQLPGTGCTWLGRGPRLQEVRRSLNRLILLQQEELSLLLRNLWQTFSRYDL